MTVATKLKEIDGVKYACTMMPATLSTHTLTRLIILVGKPALVMASGALRMNEDATNEEEVILRLVQVGVDQIFRGLTPDETNEVLLALMTGVRYEGCPVERDLSDVELFDEHFRGKVMSTYKVWSWSLMVNYQDFIDACLSSPTFLKMRKAGTKALDTKISTLLSQESAQPTEESTSET